MFLQTELKEETYPRKHNPFDEFSSHVVLPFDEFSSHVVLYFYRQSQKRRVYFQIYSIMMAWESTEVRFDLTDIGQHGSN